MSDPLAKMTERQRQLHRKLHSCRPPDNLCRLCARHRIAELEKEVRGLRLVLGHAAGAVVEDRDGAVELLTAKWIELAEASNGGEW